MEGGDVVLRLVKRDAGSTLALPREGASSAQKDEDIPWYFAAEVMDYAHIMKGTEDYMMSQYDQDITFITIQEEDDKLQFPDDTSEWSQRAVRMLEEAKEKLKGIGGPVAALQPPPEPIKERPPIQFSTDSSTPDMYSVNHASNSGQSMSEGSSPQTTPPTSVASIASTDATDASSKRAVPTAPRQRGYSHGHTGQHAPAVYYYYEALQHYYLSPLDIRILREAFGNFATFPSTILPRVERVSTGHVVDDELRKRTKYLAHLPYGCEVAFLECDWTDTVAPEVLEKFKPDIERRRKRNEEKEAREEKARVNAEKEEEKRYAHLRRRRPDSLSHAWTDQDFQPLGRVDEPGSGGEGTDVGSTGASPPWATPRQGSAFASLAELSTSPNAARTVWGTTAIAPSSPPLFAEPDRGPVDDGWLQGWERDLLREDDMVAQAQALSLGESSRSGAAVSSAGGGGGGKKKKKQKITLMSTTTRRGA